MARRFQVVAGEDLQKPQQVGGIARRRPRGSAISTPLRSFRPAKTSLVGTATPGLTSSMGMRGMRLGGAQNPAPPALHGATIEFTLPNRNVRAQSLPPISQRPAGLYDKAPKAVRSGRAAPPLHRRGRRQSLRPLADSLVRRASAPWPTNNGAAAATPDYRLRPQGPRAKGLRLTSSAAQSAASMREHVPHVGEDGQALQQMEPVGAARSASTCRNRFTFAESARSEITETDR